jgi:hypothetical protein
MSRLVLVKEALMDCVLVESVHEKSNNGNVKWSGKCPNGGKCLNGAVKNCPTDAGGKR